MIQKQVLSLLDVKGIVKFSLRSRGSHTIYIKEEVHEVGTATFLPPLYMYIYIYIPLRHTSFMKTWTHFSSYF